MKASFGAEISILRTVPLHAYCTGITNVDMKRRKISGTGTYLVNVESDNWGPNGTNRTGT